MLEIFTEVPQLLTATFLSVLGGVGNSFQAWREGKNAGLISFCSELFKALTAGLFGLYLGIWKELPDAATFLMVLLASNNSNEVLQFGREQVLERAKLLIKGKA